MKKRQILIVALSLVVVIAAYLNWAYTGDVPDSVTVTGDAETKTYGEATLVDENTSEDAEPASAMNGEYFTTARINRDKSRSDSLDILREIAEGEAPEEEKKTAYNKMTAAASATEKEGNIENLIKAKGFSDVLVYIADNTASVTVKTEGLSAADSAKIYDIVVSETGFPSDKIKIIEIK